MAALKPTLSESFNSGIDNLAAATNRVLELPLLLLVPAALVVAALATLLVFKAFRRSPGGRAGRILIPVYGALALALIAFVSDRRTLRLNQRVAELQTTAARLAARNFAQSPSLPAQSPSLSTPSPSLPAPSPSLSALKPSAAPRLHFDQDAAATYLRRNFSGLTFEARPYNDAADYVQLHSRGPVRIEAHLLVVDLAVPGVRVKLAANLSDKTYTSDFARANNCSIAVNGEAGMSPGPYSGLGQWSGNLVLNGQPILRESNGNPRPFLSFDQAGHATFTAMAAQARSVPANAYNVIWGRWDAVTAGVVQTADERNRQPRTVIGIDKTGTRLFLLVADGRQPSYSLGLTRAEAGHILAAFGASDAMLCDEGGSSCLYLDQVPGIANVPSDNGGSERATYTHFGVAFEAPPAAVSAPSGDRRGL